MLPGRHRRALVPEEGTADDGFGERCRVMRVGVSGE